MNDKIYNIKLYGYYFVIIIFTFLSVVFVMLDIIELCVLSVLIVAICLFLLFTSPRYYVFSEDKVIIKYFFGLEEKILWSNLKSAIKTIDRTAFGYYYRDCYQLFYYSDEKRWFFMQGMIRKNQKTERLMEEYCPCKFE